MAELEQDAALALLPEPAAGAVAVLLLLVVLLAQPASPALAASMAIAAMAATVICLIPALLVCACKIKRIIIPNGRARAPAPRPAHPRQSRPPARSPPPRPAPDPNANPTHPTCPTSLASPGRAINVDGKPRFPGGNGPRSSSAAVGGADGFDVPQRGRNARRAGALHDRGR